MPLTPVTDAIKTGFSFKKNDFETRTYPTIKPKDHPSKNLLVIGMPKFTVTRKVHDTKKGDQGFCKFIVSAESAREAKHIGDSYQSAMNEIYSQGTGQCDKETIATSLTANKAIINRSF